MSPAGMADAADPSPACGLAVAACRAGGVGVLDLSMGRPAPAAAIAVLDHMARHTRVPFGLRLGAPADQGDLVPAILSGGRWPGLGWLVLDPEDATALAADHGPALDHFRAAGGRLAVEVTAWDEAVAALDATGTLDALWAKGNECGGLVGEQGAFVLLQDLARRTGTPIMARGGLGPETAAGAAVLGASGLVLDDQMLLLPDSPFSAWAGDEPRRRALGAFSGAETRLLEDRVQGDRYLRVWKRPGDADADDIIAALAADLAAGAPIGPDHLARLGWGPGQVPPLGQAGARATGWTRRHGSVRAVLTAVRESVARAPAAAVSAGLVGEASPLARSHGTALPLVQGPMTHVSDRAPFLAAVADAGALPMAAVSLLRGERLRDLLAETGRLMDGRPWGVGLLGFVDPALRDAQREAIRQARPPFAIIAGGRPEQAVTLEAAGVATYLHVPSPALLGGFLDGGARRFVFEGRECGGHIGPLSCFALWQGMVEALLDQGLSDAESARVHVLFAGGLHDAPSIAAAAAIAAPLAERGVKVGFLMGTAYVLTREAVETGAVTPLFQRVVLDARRTLGLEGGPGYVSRCAATPGAQSFLAQRRRMEDDGLPVDQVREAMETFSLGRLRLATKGLLRAGPDNALTAVDEAGQVDGGMFMIGQVVTLHDAPTTLADLHRAVGPEAAALLAERARALAPAPPVAATPGEETPAGLASADIAIVGMATLLPDAPRVRALWENILDGAVAIREVPPDRWDWSTYFDPDRDPQDKIYSRWGGFLDDMVFDPHRYRMPPVALASVDPMQLLALETVRLTLEDTGLDPLPAPGRDRPWAERTAVILGFSGGLGETGLLYGARAELPRLVGTVDPAVTDRLPRWTEDSFAGLLPNVAAGRAANRLDLGGTNLTVDAACASSLAAVHQAILELRAGHADLVVTGGVDSLQSVFGFFCFAKTHALSPRGQCNTFDAQSDGIVIAEGLSMIALKRLADAERDGDRVYAVIKGVGTSSDGRARGLTAPLPAGQRRAFGRAYAHAGFPPATVGLVEAHGTGTVAGDRAELDSVIGLLREHDAPARSCVIGSVKTNVGHTKAAAGVTGLVKAALGLYHRVLPPHRGVSAPNPALAEPDCPVILSQVPRPWVRPATHPRRAGVSAFGFGGTNFHVVLEEYQGDARPWARPATRDTWPAELMAWRAADAAALRAALESARDQIAAGARPPLAGLSRALLARALGGRPPERGGGALTLAFAARDHGGLLKRLTGALAHLDDPAGKPLPRGAHLTTEAERARLAEGLAPSVALLFPGQGAQSPDMLRELAVLFPDLGEALDRAEAALADTPTFAGPPARSLARLIYPGDRFGAEAEQAAMAALTRTDITQPALGAVEIGLWGLMRRLGLRPAMAGGHSYGEYVALAAAGLLSPEDLARVSEARGRVIVEAAAAQGGDLGAMAAVLADAGAVEAALKALDDPAAQQVVLANRNHPAQTILSGPSAAIAAVVPTLEAAGLDTRPVAVSVAFHSPMMTPAADAFAPVLAGLDLTASPAFPVFSNTTAAAHDADPDFLKDTLVAHLAAPVDFQGMVQAMRADGATVFLELGPRTILSGAVARILEREPEGAPLARVIAVERAGVGLPGLLDALARLLAAGVTLDPSALFQGRAVSAVSLARLTEATPAPAPIPPGAVLVNGGYVRHPGQPRRDMRPPTHDPAHNPARNIPHADHDAPAPAADPPASRPSWMRAEPDGDETPTMTTHPPPGAPPNAGVPAMTTPLALSVAPGGDPVMVAHQDTMRRFLETQERIMLAYLGSLAATGAPDSWDAAPEAGWTPMPEPGPALVAEPVAQPAPPPAAAPAVQPVAVVAPDPAPLVAVPDPKPDSEPESEPAALDAHALLLTLTAERTGYPEDMLDPDQNLETDLGIDSVKKTEILGAFRRALPASAEEALRPEMEQLAALTTLGEIARFVDARIGAGASGAAPGAGAAMPERAASLPFDGAGAGETGGDAAEDEAAADARPPRALPRYLMRARAEPADHVPLDTLADGVVLVTPDADGALVPPVRDRLARAGGPGLTVRVAPAEALDDPEATAAWVEEARREAGPVRAVLHLAGLPPLDAAAPGDPTAAGADWTRALARGLKSLFPLLRAAAPDLRSDGRVLTASGLGGAFGRSGPAGGPVPTLAALPGGGALGLIKALSLEWTGCRLMRAVDLDMTQPPEALAEALVSELRRSAGRREVGYPEGVRTIFRTEPRSLIPAPRPRRAPGPDWVVLAVGGARGITAECLRDLAEAGATLILVGRSPLPDTEDPETIALGEDWAAIKALLLKQARARGETPRPVDIARAVAGLRRDREMRANLADFAQSGARVRYQAVDVRDETAVAALLASLYDEFGRLDVVLYGAGVIEDALLVNKTPDSVDRVLGAKLDGALALARHLRTETLQAVVLFTSVAGRYGNPGQTDYAAANETLNRLAWLLRAHWGETVMVSAINWGPWEGTRHGPGMVTAETRAQFQARGVGLVDPEGGRLLVIREILQGGPDAVEIVAGDSPWEYQEAAHGALPPLAGAAPGQAVDQSRAPMLPGAVLAPAGSKGARRLSLILDPVTAPSLDQHRLDDVPVMPFCGVMEMMAEAAALLRDAGGARPVVALEGVRWFKGLSLEGPDGTLTATLLAEPEAHDRLRLTVGAGAGAGPGGRPRPHYQGTAVLGPPPEAPPPGDIAWLDAMPDTQGAVAAPTMAWAYTHWMFHGPVFQTIVRLGELRPDGFTGRMVPSRPRALYPPAAEGVDWLFDPALLDGVFQAVSVWSRARLGVNALPTAVGRLRRFGTGPLPAALELRARIRSAADDPAVLCDVALLDGRGRARLLIEGFQAQGNAALNRLSGQWAGGQPAAMPTAAETPAEAAPDGDAPQAAE